MSTDTEVFDSDTAAALGRVFNEVWQSFPQQGDSRPLADAERLREMLAIHIIDRARHGERDTTRLKSDALSYLAKISTA
jgi:hypothetical protein